LASSSSSSCLPSTYGRECLTSRDSRHYVDDRQCSPKTMRRGGNAQVRVPHGPWPCVPGPQCHASNAMPRPPRRPCHASSRYSDGTLLVHRGPRRCGKSSSLPGPFSWAGLPCVRTPLQGTSHTHCTPPQAQAQAGTRPAPDRTGPPSCPIPSHPGRMLCFDLLDGTDAARHDAMRYLHRSGDGSQKTEIVDARHVGSQVQVQGRPRFHEWTRGYRHGPSGTPCVTDDHGNTSGSGVCGTDPSPQLTFKHWLLVPFGQRAAGGGAVYRNKVLGDR
jgi:hypothetical protein